MWLGTAAVLFGSGVWALHFVAMLAFIPAAGFSYRTAATVASALSRSLGRCWVSPFGGSRRIAW